MQALIERSFAEPDALRERVAATIADSSARVTETLKQVWPQERQLELFSAPVIGDSGLVGRLYGFGDVRRSASSIE